MCGFRCDSLSTIQMEKECVVVFYYDSLVHVIAKVELELEISLFA